MVVVVVLVVVVAVVVNVSYVIVVVDFGKRQFLILLPQNYCFPQKWSLFIDLNVRNKSYETTWKRTRRRCVRS